MIEDVMDNIEAAATYVNDALSNADNAQMYAIDARDAAGNAEHALEAAKAELSSLSPDQHKLDAIRENATAIIRLLDS